MFSTRRIPAGGFRVLRTKSGKQLKCRRICIKINQIRSAARCVSIRAGEAGCHPAVLDIVQGNGKNRILAALLLAALLLTGCGGKGAIRSVEDVPGRSIGIVRGTAAMYYASIFAQQGSQVVTYESEDELAVAIASGAVDCGIADADGAEACMRVSRRIRTLDSALADDGYCVAAALENPDLMEAVDEALAYLADTGYLKSAENTYFHGRTLSPLEEETDFEHTLTVAVNTDLAPYAFLDDDGNFDGLDVAVAAAVCRYVGVNVTFVHVDGEELLEAVRNGNADLGLGVLVRTEETEQLVLLSRPYVQVSQQLLVQK